MIFYLAAVGAFLAYSKSKYFPLAQYHRVVRPHPMGAILAFSLSVAYAVLSYGTAIGGLVFLACGMLALSLVQMVLQLPRIYLISSVGLFHLLLLLSFL
ncbi:hypothetical protein LAG90_18190 [Marinilongibacter aquaticus]|uniref:hypothetical protein n=1 Tax=Marinilongibacter aquaticus TaxID=2975157 RepID=UPI0021BD5114|nr:hypothetical protein [Marinilongibacter aquaticus]UBM58733.1 hypothetical protein LAG90_18190 [Marinilongibacter aquaticus]